MDRDHAEREVVTFVRAWIAAELRRDTAFLERTLADDFVGVGPLGFMLTKREWVGRHEAGNLEYDTLDVDELTVRIYDGAAILIGRQVQEARYRGHRVDAQFRTTMVLVYRREDWQLAGLHMSPIGQPPSFAPQEVTQ
jgi:hypothetical protein